MLTILLTIALDTTPVKPLPVLLPRPVQTEKTMKKTVTIEQVKACNVMPEPFKKTLDGLCDCWYGIALQEGKTEAEAAKIALDKLTEKMLSFSNSIK